MTFFTGNSKICAFAFSFCCWKKDLRDMGKKIIISTNEIEKAPKTRKIDTAMGNTVKLH